LAGTPLIKLVTGIDVNLALKNRKMETLNKMPREILLEKIPNS